MKKSYLYIGLGLASFFLFILIVKDIKKPKVSKVEKRTQDIALNATSNVTSNIPVSNIAFSDVSNKTESNNVSNKTESKTDLEIEKKENLCEKKKTRQTKKTKVAKVKKKDKKEIVKEANVYGTICISGICKEIGGSKGETISYRHFITSGE